MIDQVFTPDHLANEMVDLAKAHAREFGVVADFAAGDGALLHAAAGGQQDLQVVGLDINRTTVRRLKALNPLWQVGSCDFLSPRSRASSPVLRRNRGRVSTALLNPPFSCRGGRREQVSIGGTHLTCSVAMAFVLTATEYLTPTGQIIAVVPRGVESAERDEAAWELLRSMGTVEVVGYRDRGTFPDTALRSLLLRFTMGRPTLQGQASRTPARTKSPRPIISLVRGTVQMHRARLSSAGMPLVHTTHLSNGQLRPLHVTSVPGRSCRGAVVLIPRVGRPMRSKVVRVDLRSDLALSDCVIALECASEDESVEVQRAIEDRWDEFEASYGGSCAPYITLKTLQDVLDRFGFQAEVRRERRRPSSSASKSPSTSGRSSTSFDQPTDSPPPRLLHGLSADRGVASANATEPASTKTTVRPSPV